MYIRFREVGHFKKPYPILYEEMVRLSLKYRDKNTDQNTIDKLSISGMFPWSSSPQGGEFWAYVSGNNWDRARDICPELFIENTEGLTIRNNGLFKMA